MTLKIDGSTADRQSTLMISAKVLTGELPACWALLETTGDKTSSGWSVYGLGDFNEDQLPQVEAGDHLIQVTFSEVGDVLPFIVELLEWGNGEDYPLLMETWAYKGERRWHPWEDLTKYGGCGRIRPPEGARLLGVDDPMAAIAAGLAESANKETLSIDRALSSLFSEFD